MHADTHVLRDRDSHATFERCTQLADQGTAPRMVGSNAYSSEQLDCRRLHAFSFAPRAPASEQSAVIEGTPGFSVAEARCVAVARSSS